MAGLTHASPSVEAAPVAASGKRRFSPGRDALRRFLRHRMAAASILVLALLALSIVLGPLLWRIPINEIDFTARLAPPSWEHPFGTDDLGQDLLARMIYGGRISLAVGFAAMGVADRYAELHSQTWGDAVDATALIPHMLEAFMARDRGFRQSRKKAGL